MTTEQDADHVKQILGGFERAAMPKKGVATRDLSTAALLLLGFTCTQ